MAKSFDELPPRAALIEVARLFYSRGWMYGTAGNLSTRANDSLNDARSSCWITASGVPKGMLEEQDFLRVHVGTAEILDRPDPNAAPSAETDIHRAVYKQRVDANACLHVHTVDSCIAVNTNATGKNEIRLPPLEMIKGLGIWEQTPNAVVPVFDNHLDVKLIADNIENYLKNAPTPVPAVMIRNHGITVWGKTIQEAVNQTEVLEYIFSYLARTGANRNRPDSTTQRPS